jgi:hypothetical protein
MLKFLLIILGALVIVVAAYWLLVRPRVRRWGATGAEVARTWPGDDLVPVVKVGYTQAITVDAPAEAVWPWLVQIGYQRAGWYTYDWVYALMGANDFYDGKRSAERIIPELQNVKTGDAIKIFEQAPFEVVSVEPNRQLILLARVDTDSGETFELSDAMPAHYMNQSWAFVLEEVDEHTTRLVVRWRGDYSPGLANTLGLGIPTEAGALVMQPAMLRGIRDRAEARWQATRGQ